MILNQVAVCSRTFSKNTKLRSEMEKRFRNVRFNEEEKKLQGDRLVDFLKDSEGAIVALEKIDRSVLARIPKMKFISKYGVGLDNINIPELESLGVELGWRGGVNKRSVSELTLAMMMSAIRKTTLQFKETKNGKWENFGGGELSGKRVGIIGFGHIGQDIATLLTPFGCEILVNDILDISEKLKVFGARKASKEEIYRTADVITLHIPLTEKTEWLIKSEELRMMEEKVVLVNTSRGRIVSEKDLYHFLKNNPRASALFDVFETEPEKNSPLYQLDNFYATPHIGGSSVEGIFAMGMSAITLLEDYFKNRKD